MKISRARRKIAEKIWGGRTPDEVLSKRFKMFVLLVISLVAASTLIKQVVVTLPNFELIIPSLVVIGSFSLYCGSTKFWRYLNRYFGLVALISVYLIYFAYEGFHSIYIFTFPGFIMVWALAMRNKLSMFDKFKTLLGRTLLTAAIAIILFDVWTGLIGHTLTTGTSLWIAFLGQIPFTMYHLTSLLFIPPLVGLGKMLVKVKIPVPVAVGARAGVKASARR